MYLPKSIIFVDGENLTLRYQAMVDKGHQPKEDVVHDKDAFVWSPSITKYSAWKLTRMSYYTTAVGNDEKLQELAETLKSVKYEYGNYVNGNGFSFGFGFLNPHIFKKQKGGNKTKSVDINLVTDLLRHTYNRSVEEVCVLSGDGDYLPTLHEVMRQGIQVFVGAFSSGLDSRLRTQSDEFIDLDKMFFEEK